MQAGDDEPQTRKVPQWLYWAGMALAVAFLVLTFTNASWVVDAPRGSVKLIAHRGVAQQFDPAGVTADQCTAALIEQPVHDFLEGSTASLGAVRRAGAQMVELAVSRTADGQIAVFSGDTLDCLTDGTGPVSAKTLAELKQLDLGHNYTADGGKTYPFRGKGIGQIASIQEALAALYLTPVLFSFQSDNAADADALAAALQAAGRDAEKQGDGFRGPAAPIARIRQHFPESWVINTDDAAKCGNDYLLYGWTGIMPASCHKGTMVIPLDRQWPYWGWPNRLMARMEAVGGKVLLAGPHSAQAPYPGLTRPQQLGEVPLGFSGYLWVEDIWTVGPALRPSQDRRTPAERQRAEEGLARRAAQQ